MTKWQLFQALGAPVQSDANVVTIRNRNNVVFTGYVLSVEREDGSGRCFNVALRPCDVAADRTPVTVFVRTDD